MYTVFRVKMGFTGGIKEMAGAGREIFKFEKLLEMEYIVSGVHYPSLHVDLDWIGLVGLIWIFSRSVLSFYFVLLSLMVLLFG
jgi:hypothetical protein